MLHRYFSVSVYAGAVPSSTIRCSLFRGHELILVATSCRYLTPVVLTYGAFRCIRGVLCLSLLLLAASWMETRTRGPSHQRGTVGKLSRSVLFPTVGCRQFQDLQPRDVDHTLFLSFLGLLVVVGNVICCSVRNRDNTYKRGHLRLHDRRPSEVEGLSTQPL